jgi:hypothetical protein
VKAGDHRSSNPRGYSQTTRTIPDPGRCVWHTDAAASFEAKVGSTRWRILSLPQTPISKIPTIKSNLRGGLSLNLVRSFSLSTLHRKCRVSRGSIAHKAAHITFCFAHPMKQASSLHLSFAGLQSRENPRLFPNLLPCADEDWRGNCLDRIFHRYLMLFRSLSRTRLKQR